jgi:ABC-type transport system substrate-binding protein
VRVAVWEPPDPAASTLGGAAVRALVLPQLFVAGPRGDWQPSLVAPGSDRTAPDQRSASFGLRAGARWTNGASIGAADLQRSADKRFVAGVDGPDAAGHITVRFTEPLPGWRRLWSGADSISAPGAGVWGGPFTVASMTPGLETVLHRNDSWWGAPEPYLDEVRLVLVPDSVMTRQLFQQHKVDVVWPPAYTVRSQQYGLGSVGGASGWDVRLLLNPARVDAATRKAVVASVERGRFVDTLLAGEASVLNGWDGSDDTAWSQVRESAVDAAALKGKTVQLTGEVEEPMTALLERAMQKRAQGAGGTIELRNAEAPRVEGWVAASDYAAAVVLSYDGPTVCWTCRWSSVDAAAATAADAGDGQAASRLEAEVRDQAVVLPLWRLAPFVAFAPGVHGVVANGEALSPAWNAWEWWRQ